MLNRKRIILMTEQPERIWASSRGTRYALLCAMYTRYCLESVALSHGEQLEMVEDLVKLQSGDVTSAAVKAIRSCDHATARMIEAAIDLPAKHPWQHGTHWTGIEMHMREGFDVLTGRAWPELCRLNPSLEKALQLCHGYWIERPLTGR
jgi:hypothetical protein